MATYDFEGIGKAGALLEFSALASSPVAFLTNGFLGDFTFWVLTKLNIYLANKGLMVLNIGVADIETLIEKDAYNASFDEAFRAIHDNPNKLTDAQRKAIDDKVIAAFRKFASFNSLSNS